MDKAQPKGTSINKSSQWLTHEQRHSAAFYSILLKKKKSMPRDTALDNLNSKTGIDLRSSSGRQLFSTSPLTVMEKKKTSLYFNAPKSDHVFYMNLHCASRGNKLHLNTDKEFSTLGKVLKLCIKAHIMNLTSFQLGSQQGK